MKILILITLFIFNLQANDSYESSKTCKACHSNIYEEFYNSSHRKSSIYNDPIHKAVWEKHPKNKEEKYVCAKCHTPSDIELMDKLASGQKAMPQENKIQTQEPISCATCHSIESVEQHAKSNKNIRLNKEKTFYSARDGQKNNSNVEYETKSSLFGLVKEKSGSPFHKIDFSNDDYYTGKVCLGCHSHKQNSHEFDICSMDEAKYDQTATDKNCISCHMPMVEGSFSNSKSTKKHRYHGFAGSIHKPQLLAKYVKISFEEVSDGFNVTIKNEANHQLLLHPLRVGELQVSITRDGKTKKLEAIKFMRVIGKDGKPTMPWLADTVIKDNHIKAKEARKIHFKETLQEGDYVEAILGHYIVNPKAAKKLGLDNNKDLTKFVLFKKENFIVK